jgi:hypothetical protein
MEFVDVTIGGTYYYWAILLPLSNTFGDVTGNLSINFSSRMIKL